jgi:hypothetical protein
VGYVVEKMFRDYFGDSIARTEKYVAEGYGKRGQDKAKHICRNGVSQYHLSPANRVEVELDDLFLWYTSFSILNKMSMSVSVLMIAYKRCLLIRDMLLSSVCLE